MPRFQDKHILALKRAMLPRLPGCYFTAEDCLALEQETGLNKAQIEQWAKNLRFRLPRDEDKEAFFRIEGEQEKVHITYTEKHEQNSRIEMGVSDSVASFFRVT